MPALPTAVAGPERGPAAGGAVPRLAGPAMAAVAAALAAAFIWWADPTTPGGLIPECPTKFFLHIDCPGCGSCRMLYALLHGNIRAALHYNAVGLAGVAILGYGYARWTWGRWRNAAVVPWHARRYAPHVVLAVVLAWLVVRNIPVEPFTGLRV